MFNMIESWKMTETDKVVALVKEVECWRLGNWDGCCCSFFSVRNVDVEISCGKNGQQAVWVSSRSMDYRSIEELKPVMTEVIRQVEKDSGRSGRFEQHITVGQ